MQPKNSGGSTKFPGGYKVIHRTAQTAFVRTVTPRLFLRNTATDLLNWWSSVLKTHMTSCCQR